MPTARPVHRFLIIAALCSTVLATPALAVVTPDMERMQAEAARVSITRDDWGIAHVAGKSDADAVFGMIYAQAEDDFGRIEANYLAALGRTAEAEGEQAIWRDLRERMWVDPIALQAQYRASPAWLRQLMDAWADGLNYYLATHPDVHPKVLTHFQPWMTLAFSEGSIGGDIEHVSLTDIANFYGKQHLPPSPAETGALRKEPSGSNGIAIAPKNSNDGHALLWINPHTSFYFRSELQMTSEDGLDAYGAATWGQFFVYQGFNTGIGWMHTSSGVDNIDQFAETIIRKHGKLFYRYGTELRPVQARPITIAYRKPDGTLGERHFTVFRTHHGPIVGESGGRWLAEALMWRPTAALEQSWLRTKATDLASYLKVADLKANSSNDTLFADTRGEIAYLHPQFVPIRDDKFDYTRPVDGSDPATDWRGLHSLASLPQAINPAIGWAKNTNNWPWTAAGPDSPKAKDFPRYMDQAGENERGVHSDMLMKQNHDFTPASLTAAAFDSYLPAFATLLPPLAAAYDALPANDPARAKLAGPIALLEGWDYRWGSTSEATSLAIFWGDELARKIGAPARAARMIVPDYIAKRVPPAQQLAALASAVDLLAKDFGSWRVPWGQINRFQRLDDAIEPHFDDSKPSVAIPFVSSLWGSLASFGAKAYPNTRKYYGTSGNSFVAVVDFGPTIRAWAVTAGGESGDPSSKHFKDEVQRYADGNLRPVYFYPQDLIGHAERRYHPGE